LVFLILEKQLANIPDRGFLFLRNTLLLYSLSPYHTDGQNHRQRNKYTCFTWAGGNFFPVVLLFQFLFWQEIGFGFTHYLCT
jgi:hypothetical protein